MLQTIVSTISGGMTASIGSFVHEKNSQESEKLFKLLCTVQWMVATIVIINFYILADGFITLWLGSEYIINEVIFILLLMNTFIIIVRGPIDGFIAAYGLFHDVKAPVLELLINIIISVVGGYYFGIAGVLSGTFFSVGLVVLGWKPYFIYKSKFAGNYKGYLITCVIRLVITSIVVLIVIKFVQFINIEVNGVFSWIKLALVTTCISIVSTVLVYLVTDKSARKIFKKMVSILKIDKVKI
jgi:O-antigen/teichoic acid export membrane protein